MKKRFLCMLLALATVFSLAVPAFAETGDEAEIAEEISVPVVILEDLDTAEDEEAPAEETQPTTATAIEDSGIQLLAGTISGEFDNGVSWTLVDNILTFSGSGEVTGSSDEETYWYTAKEIVLGNGITGIGERAFVGLYQLTDVSFPASLTSIGAEAFLGCYRLTLLKLPAGLTSIGDRAFANCTQLNNLTLPSGLTSIGAEAFLNCSTLDSMELPASVTSVGEGAFGACTSLWGITVANGNKSYVAENGVLFDINQGTLVAYPAARSGSYTIPTGVTEIAGGAFYGCTSLRSVTFNRVTSIGAKAFYSCSGLTSVDLSNVTKIGSEAFRYCSNLANVTLTTGVELGSNAFANTPWNGNQEEEQGDFVKDVNDKLVKYNGSDTTVVIPEGVTGIDGAAFEGGNCAKITSLTIPASLKSIDAGALACLTGLKTIKVASGSKNYTVVSDVLFNAAKTELVCYPSAKTGSSYEIPATVTSIGASAFENCYNLTKITIPGNVDKIGAKAFYDCRSLKELTIPATVTSVGDYAFGYRATNGNHSKLSGCSISGYTGSAAETYANKFDIEFKALGASATSLGTPSVTAKNVDGGLEISWKAVKGAYLYHVTYAKEGGKEAKLVDTTDISYLWDKAESGTKYFFTVTCVTADGKTSLSAAGSDSRFYIAAPEISSVKSTSSGLEIKWKAVTGADKYAVYTLKDGKLTEIGSTEGTSFVYTAAKDGTTYTIVVRGLTASGKTLSAYKGEGYTITHNAPEVLIPAITSVENVTGGMLISWSKVTNAENYRVFYKKTGASKWSTAGDTTSTSYTWADAKSGTKYSFAIRCVSKDGKTYTSDMSAAESKYYIAATKISSVSNASTGIKISWSKVSGASKYRVYYKTSSNGSWIELADTKKTSYTWTEAVSGKKYYFAVCGMSSSGLTLSDYSNKDSITFFARPKISSVKNDIGGLKISWGKVKGAAQYRIYYKTSSKGSWVKLTDTTATSYVWSGAKSGTKYYFSVRSMSSTGKTLSAYASTKSRFYIAAPELPTVTSTSGSIKISWSKVDGADKYRVYYKTSADGAWKKLTNTTGTSYTWTGAKSGTKYYFTVRGLTASGKTLSAYNTTGKSITAK